MARLSARGRPAPQDDAGEASTWPVTWSLLHGEVRRLAFATLLLALALGLAAGMARALLPQSYTATAQVMIDPRGLQVFQNDLTTGQYDANAAVNFVESQIHVIVSERVLARALRYAAAPDGAPAPALSAAEVDRLRRAIRVSRAERSYILDISARDRSPEAAARLANAVMRAYLDEDLDSRSAIARRLTGDLTSRLDELRQRLADSEQRAEDYRRQNNLVSVDDRLIVDQQLAAAVDALALAEERLSTFRARADQLAGMDPSVTAALVSGSDRALLNTLVTRQVAMREEVARLSIRLGEQHPSLRTARGQADEVDVLLRAELARIRDAGQSALRQAAEERDNLAQTVARLSEEAAGARQSSIQLRTLQQQILSDRELLSSFETRAGEMAEFGSIDSANIRVLSTALAPERTTGLTGIVVWTLAGAFIGMAAGLALAALRALLAFSRAAAASAPAQENPRARLRTVHAARARLRHGERAYGA